MQLDETPEVYLRLREEMVQARAELRQTRQELTATREQLAASVAYAAGLDQFISRQRDEVTGKAAGFATSKRTSELASALWRWAAPLRALRQRGRRKE